MKKFLSLIMAAGVMSLMSVGLATSGIAGETASPTDYASPSPGATAADFAAAAPEAAVNPTAAGVTVAPESAAAPGITAGETITHTAAPGTTPPANEAGAVPNAAREPVTTAFPYGGATIMPRDIMPINEPVSGMNFSEMPTGMIDANTLDRNNLPRYSQPVPANFIPPGWRLVRQSDTAGAEYFTLAESDMPMSRLPNAGGLALTVAGISGAGLITAGLALRRKSNRERKGL